MILDDFELGETDFVREDNVYKRTIGPVYDLDIDALAVDRDSYGMADVVN